MNATAANQPLFLGDSEMAGLIRHFDWSASPLGSIAYWPDNLRFTLDLLLHSAFPMTLFWGRENTCFYNDAFRAVLGAGGKHPSALGRAGEQVWPEAWDIIRSLIEEVKEGKSTRLYQDLCAPIYRNGKTEEAYWTFNYSPVKNSEGTVEGVLVICQETTQKVLEQQRAEELRLQLHHALESCDLGTWDLHPQTRVFRCNEKTKEIFGLSGVADINLKSAVDVMHPDDRERVQQAIERSFDPASGGRYDVEYVVVHPASGQHHIIRAKGKTYFDADGKPEKFTGTVQNVTEERLSSQRKEKMQQLVEHSKDYMSMATLDGQMTYMNAAGRMLIGIEPDRDLSTLTIKDFYSDEQFRRVQAEIIPALNATGFWSGFVRIKHQQSGEEIPCHGNYMLIRDSVSGKVISRGLTLRDLRPELVVTKELEDSEKRFRNLVQEAPVATAIYIGEEMRIQWANDAMIKLWGKDKSVIGKTVREALPELEGQPFHGLLHDVFTTGQMYQATEDKGELMVEGQLQTFFFNFSYKPLRDTDGKVYGILNMAIDVTEQVKTKRKLEESEKNFRSLIMQAPVGICLLAGEDYVVDLANEQYLALVGRKREGFVSHPLWDVLPEAREQGFDALLNGVRTSGKPYFGYEQPVSLLRNGVEEQVYVNFVYEPLFDEDKNVHSILVIAIDITQQVIARRAIESAEERARLAVESAKLGTYELNLLTDEMIASVRLNELFDTDPTHTHPNYISKIHPDDLPVRQKAHEQALTTGKLQYESRVVRRDGTMNWIEVFGQYYFDEQQKPYKIVGIVYDITQQKMVEEEREKFLSLSHYSRDFIGMCDMNMKTLYVNKAGIGMLGIEGDVMQASLWDCFFPEDHAYLKETFFPAVLKEGHGEVEIRFRHFQTGAPVWVIYSVFMIHDSKGKPSVMATVSRDITERKNMEKELEKRVAERTAELVKLNDELQQFTYVSSHDLKEPLRKIQMFGQLAQQHTDPSNTKAVASMEKVVQSASRMSTLITDLLNYSTLSNIQRSFTAVDLNILLQHTIDDAELLIKEKAATIHKNELPVVEGVSFQLSQLFFNLLNNALKFGRQEEPLEITIEASPLREEERAAYPSLLPVAYHKITFADNGIGFRPEYAQKIFVVFQRLNDRSQYGGNGIGLSICKKIVENHHGEIFATAEAGKGAVFTVLLPQTQAQA
ncbi:PAS domain S-box protein [Flavisolibacter nicotianae]|uniref:PAS domain S-box protein n=1 Tax=Flavisolibacter nicotianae TaxID=2364882 RepID=UPI000EADE8CE|nr:PAS domain S-box protein [Flavisolibacter nicotianae]